MSRSEKLPSLYVWVEGGKPATFASFQHATEHAGGARDRPSNLTLVTVQFLPGRFAGEDFWQVVGSGRDAGWSLVLKP